MPKTNKKARPMVYPVLRQVIFFFCIILLFGFSNQAWSQEALPSNQPLFQNNDRYCQNISVVPEAYSIACGVMQGPADSTQQSFPDCITLSERRPSPDEPQTIDGLSFIPNRERHDANSCPGQQLDTPQILQIKIPESFDGAPDRVLGSIQNANFDQMGFDGFAFPRLPSVGAPGLEDWIGKPNGGFELLGDLSIFPYTYPRVVRLRSNADDALSPFPTDPFRREGEARCVDVNSSYVDSCPSEKNTAVLDCNGDGLSDLSTVVFGKMIEHEQKFGIYVDTLINHSGSLINGPSNPPKTNLVIDLSGNESPRSIAAAIDTADFNNDGIMDLAIVADIQGFGGLAHNRVVICLHKADPQVCDFDCNFDFNLAPLLPEVNFKRGAEPFSIVTGDFNGDQAADAAISLMGLDGNSTLLSRILYLFGDNSGTFNAGQSLQVSTSHESLDQNIPLLSLGEFGITDVVPTSLAKGHFDNDGVLDIAVTNYHAPPGGRGFPSNTGRFQNFVPQGFALVLTSNDTKTTNFKPLASPLEYPQQDLTLVSPQGNQNITAYFNRSSGIASVDFDHCGGDDIITLAESCPGALLNGLSQKTPNFGDCTEDPANSNFDHAGERQALLFLNANEAPQLNLTAGLPQLFPINTPIALTATCQDPTQDQRSFTWKTITSPNGATVQFSPQQGTLVGTNNNSSTMMTVNQPGSYTIIIECTDYCGLQASETTEVSFNFTASETPPGRIPAGELPPENTVPTGSTPNNSNNTQGSNLFGCQLHRENKKSGETTWDFLRKLQFRPPA